MKFNPALVPVIGSVLLVSVLAMAPALFRGRIPADTRLLSEFAPWATYPYHGHPLTAGGDSFLVYLPDRKVAVADWKAGRIPLWNPNVSGGVPILGQQTANPLDPLILLSLVLPTGFALGLEFAILLAAAGLGTLLWLRALGVRDPPALALAGVALVLNPYFVTWLELRVFLAGLATLPLALWALERLGSPAGGRGRHAGVLALAVGYGALAGTLQTLALVLVVLGLRAGWLLLRPQPEAGSRPRGWLMAAGLAAGLAIGALPIAATVELLVHSTRGAGAGYYADANFLPWRTPALWFAPDVFGWPSLKTQELLPGFNRTIAGGSGWGALGILPLGLALLALWRRAGPRSERIFWGGLAGLPLLVLLALGTPAYGVLSRLWPGIDDIDLLRGLFLVNLGGTVLAAFGAAELAALWRQPARRPWLGALAAYLAFGVAALTLGRLGVPAPHPWLRDLVPLLAVVAAVAGIGLLPSGRRMPAGWKAWVLVAVTAVELGRIHFLWNPFSHPDSDYPSRPAVPEMQALLGPPTYYRFLVPGTLRAFPPNTASVYGLADVRGYSNLPIARYRTLLECAEGTSMRNKVTVDRVNSPIYRLLGAAYVALFFPGGLDSTVYRPFPITAPERGFWKRRDPLPRAFLVHTVIPARDEAQIRSALGSPGFDPLRVAFLEASAGPPPPCRGPDRPERIAVTDYRPTRVTVLADAAAPGLLILSDVYYPGWSATVDGEPAPVLPADWGLRGVGVASGIHEVTFTYRPRWLLPGAVLMGLGLLAGLALLGIRRPLHRR